MEVWSRQLRPLAEDQVAVRGSQTVPCGDRRRCDGGGGRIG